MVLTMVYNTEDYWVLECMFEYVCTWSQVHIKVQLLWLKLYRDWGALFILDASHNFTWRWKQMQFKKKHVLYFKIPKNVKSPKNWLTVNVSDIWIILLVMYRLCGLVVRVLGFRSGGPGSIPGTIRKKSSGPGTRSTQPRNYSWGATW
jgi:hypothetical protein